MSKSFPWPGIVGGAGAGVDSGRYLAPEWWAVWGTQQRASSLIVPAAANPLRTTATWTNIGVYYGVPNQLEVTDAGGFVAEVDTGAALVDGQFYYNEAIKSLTMPASQTYYVVLRKNFTAAAYTPPGYAAGDGVVPAYTTRITWVSALVQSTDRTTYWDIPLATVVTDGSEITSVTDTREYVDAETKYGFVQSFFGRNTTDGTDVTPANFGNAYGSIELADSKYVVAYGRTRVPSDYITNFNVKGVIVTPGGAGNIYAGLYIYAGACGEAYNEHGLSNGTAAEAINAGGSYYSCHRSTTITTLAPQDIVLMYFWRDATNILDTVGADLHFVGFVTQYFGWR